MSLKGYKNSILPIKNKLYRFALSIVKDESEAADVVQEVCIKLWQQWDEFSHIDNIEAWSMRLIKNKAIDTLRSKHRRTESLERVYHLESNIRTPYEVAASNNTIELVKKYMDQLPEKQRMVIQLRDIEEFSYQEISNMLDMPLNQVKVNLFRARQQMRTQLLKSASYGS